MTTIKKIIIWDWNGTMLDDIDICIDSINPLLKERNLQEIHPEKYREIFTFPVKEYYIKAGFDFSEEAFEIPAHQFMDNYREKVPAAKLHTGISELLSQLSNNGKTQAILSVMEQELLRKSVSRVGIDRFFDKIYGINDHYGGSKTELGLRLMAELNANPGEILLIGDTLHDFEVADEMGIDSILISHGHQSKERLLTSGRPVVDNFEELKSKLDTYF